MINIPVRTVQYKKHVMIWMTFLGHPLTYNSYFEPVIYFHYRPWFSITEHLAFYNAALYCSTIIILEK